MRSTALIDWLQGLPDALVFVVVVGALILGVVLLPQGLRLLLFRHPRQELADGANEAFKAVVSFIVFLLAFSFVQVQGQLRSTEELVGREAHVLNVTDRVLVRFGDPQAAAMRTVLHEYARLVVADEWPLLQQGRRSEKVEHAYNELALGVRRLEPLRQREQSLYNELLRSVDELGDLREARVAATALGVPALYWWTLAALFTLLALIALLMPATLERALTLGGLVCAAGLMLTMVVITDGPFEGQARVLPTAIERVLGAMEGRS